MKSFTTTAPEKYKWDGGYGGEIPGPWLCCYMLRRFGWPNEGSDDYKNLMSWTLTTPIEGFYLSVTPYLGGSNLHFGVRFTKEVGRKIDYDAGRNRFWKRQDQEALRWWKAVGSKKFSFGSARKGDQKEKLVHAYNDGDKIWGIYERLPEHQNNFNITAKTIRKTEMLIWWLNEFRVKKLGGKVPKMSKRERRVGNPFRLQCERALRQTMLDLLRPTHVRDISFTPFGDIEHTPEAVKRYTNQAGVGYFAGAGNTPEYWYSKAATKDRAAARKRKPGKET